MHVHDRQPSRKRSTNVSLSEDLVREAKQLGISISAACEQGLAGALKQERERRWIEENAEAIRSYNEWIRRNGVPLAKYRRF
ncbi:type II toxin-antitoxin system CcdA family antitoxin [uncultured Sphingomonas sp.]|uniref:type II toxin-antitoxin system CcdA family antitoxin n=1 Tax=uncultured Sphingomonas sp. TaxID=158754 RepID=UPI0025EF79D5|nr:type II toxin-antitoxin system CcdA family antitoxin [uncultured Sphingomonas sp.]